jgi:hypothetical protein
MPVARIVTRHAPHESEALKVLSEQLGAAGYEVEIAPLEASGAEADLVVEFDELPVAEALEAAVRMARAADADVYIAPGLFAQPAMRARPEHEPIPTPSHSEPSEQPVAESTNTSEVHDNVGRGSVIGSTLDELGTALAEGRVGVRDTVERVRVRAAGAWARWQQQRAEAAQALRLARERREMELEERRRQHEAELQRRAEEHEQLLAERERLAAEQERALREQMARDAAVRAERERAEREAMAREAARRAELFHAEEQERRRLAAIQAERMRAQREQDAQRAAALAAERTRLQREEEARRAAALASERREPEPRRPVEQPAPPIAEPVYASAPPVFRRRLVRRRRRIPSARQRQWQRAAFLASVTTLAAMLGFALAANMRAKSPLPASLIQNQVQQQIPFGPAKAVPAATQTSAPVRAAVPVKTGAPKPSPAKPAAPRRSRSGSSERDIVAEDEVIVRHHRPASRLQRPQTTAAIRKITDEN